MGSALALTGCITTNPPMDAGVDAISRSDAVPPCDPSLCESEHCTGGRCAKPCSAEGGACPAGETCCEGTFCTDLSDDPQNCGACGNACGPRRACSGAICSDVVL